MPSPSDKEYALPEASLLRQKPDDRQKCPAPEELESDRRMLSELFGHSSISASVTGHTAGLQATCHEVKLGPGILLEDFAQFAPMMDNAMPHSRGRVRLLLPIPGKDRVGIEIPREKRGAIASGALFASDAWRDCQDAMPLMLGCDLAGQAVIADLTAGHNLLLAGDSGCGQSECLNQLVSSLLLRQRPSQLRLVIASDPASPVQSPFANAPHLLAPVLLNDVAAAVALRWCRGEVRRRQQLIAQSACRTMREYNAAHPESPMPQLVVVISELSSLLRSRFRPEILELFGGFITSGNIGLNFIAATQHPSEEVLTDEILAAFPMRLAFHCEPLLSEQLVGNNDAAALLGEGDMLFRNDNAVIRLQCGQIRDDECRKLCASCHRQCDPEPSADLIDLLRTAKEASFTKMPPQKKSPLQTPLLPFADDDSAAVPPAVNDDAADGGNAADNAGATGTAMEDTANHALAFIMKTGKATRQALQDGFGVTAERARNLLDEMYSHGYLRPRQDNPDEYDLVPENIPAELQPDFQATRKTIEQLHEELAAKIAAGDPGSRTVAEYNRGIHAIGKKIVEEAAEVWMSAEYESPQRTSEEISQLIYHLLVLMIRRGISLDDLYGQL